MPLIIDESNAVQAIAERLDRQACDPWKNLPACKPDPYNAANHPIALPYRSVLPTIPRDLWPDACAAAKTANLHTLTKDLLPPHDQGQTNYCWAHGTVRALELLEAAAGMRPNVLSAESIAVPLTRPTAPAEIAFGPTMSATSPKPNPVGKPTPEPTACGVGSPSKRSISNSRSRSSASPSSSH
jgi:hypothetical protein